jgi:hypothetical protein
LSIIRLEQIEIVSCSVNNSMNQVSSVRNKRLLPPYLIRGRNDNLSNHNFTEGHFLYYYSDEMGSVLFAYAQDPIGKIVPCLLTSSRTCIILKKIKFMSRLLFEIGVNG